MLRHRLRSADDRGSQFVEFAVYLPFFLLVVTIALEVFFSFAAMERMNNAARVSADAAGRYGAEHGRSLAHDTLPGYLQDQAKIDVYRVEHGYATRIEVRMPLIFSYSGLDLPLTRTVEMPR
nr:TadE/TadG family type IV pilus assembly protein [Nocardiopsis mwathae]